MMFETIDWHTLASVTVVVSFLAVIAIILIRSRLARDFAPIHAHNNLANSHAVLKEDVGQIKVRLGNIPSHHDLQEVATRVARVEAGTAGLQASMVAMNQNLIGIAKDVRMLVEHAIDGEK